MNMKQAQKTDKLTNKIYTENLFAEQILSARSSASFDSQYSDGFAPETKKLEKQIKELKKVFDDDVAWNRCVQVFKILSE